MTRLGSQVSYSVGEGGRQEVQGQVAGYTLLWTGLLLVVAGPKSRGERLCLGSIKTDRCKVLSV